MAYRHRESNHPADERPAEQEIDDQDRRKLVMVAHGGDYCRHKIGCREQGEKKQGRERMASTYEEDIRR